MIEEIPVDRTRQYAAYFPGPQLEMVVASAVEGNTRGQLWADAGPGGERVALLWDKGNNVFYWGGRLGSAGAVREWVSLVHVPVKERAIAEGLARFRVRALSSSLERVVPTLFQGVTLSEYRELFLSFNRERSMEIALPAIEGVTYRLVDKDLLGRDDLRNLERVRAEIRWMWPSEERFCARGFGVVAISADAVIGWCTAEYVSQDRCGIGIETVEAYENRGVGTATAARFVEECVRRRIQPHWECGVRNLGSIRVAVKVGFEPSEEATFWVGAFRA